MTDMEMFSAHVRKIYKMLYEADLNQRRYPGLDEAVERFDSGQYPKDILKSYCRYIQDFIGSDREAAAFIFACYDFSLI